MPSEGATLLDEITRGSQFRRDPRQAHLPVLRMEPRDAPGFSGTPTLAPPENPGRPSWSLLERDAPDLERESERVGASSWSIDRLRSVAVTAGQSIVSRINSRATDLGDQRVVGLHPSA
jgi:hypothetical protein